MPYQCTLAISHRETTLMTDIFNKKIAYLTRKEPELKYSATYTLD